MEINTLEEEIVNLRRQLLEKEEILCTLKKQIKEKIYTTDLSNEDIARFSRQIILPNVRVNGQIKLKNSSVLIIGAGGLGCPAALYLVGAGIGHIGIVDYDLVEINNLHRQLLHTECNLGKSKVLSAELSLSKLNSRIKISKYNEQLNSENALRIISQYEVIVDASDNVATRYLINDACIFAKKPLVSGSALQMEGQLTVYNYKLGPCYRCIFPVPPPPETVTNCGDGGVIGAVTGVIGALQALETIKIILENDGILSGRLLLFDGQNSTFRNVKLREKRNNCDVCSEKPIITQLIDYELYCGMKATDKDSFLSLLNDNERITVQNYNNIIKENTDHVLIDVRSIHEFEICHLDNSINIPIRDILENKKVDEIKNRISDNTPVLVICRRGNDSQRAVKHLQSVLPNVQYLKDIIGGLHAWTNLIDKNFPKY